MRVCVVSFKECWASPDGRWLSSGGFPLQMAAIASLFDHTTLVVVATHAREGGIELPRAARVVALRSPRGEGFRRKVSVVTGLPYYLRVMMREIANADVVHTPVPGDLSLLGLLAGAVLRKPLIVRYGSSWEATTETTWMNRVTKAMMRRFAGGRNVMLVTGLGGDRPSQDMHWLFATAIAREELERIRPDLTRVAGQPRRAVYVGRLSPEKGLRYLIEAMGQLAASWPSGEPRLVLTLLGDGPERARLEPLATAAGCAHLVTFDGQVDRTTLLERLPHFDVCVLPSLTESFCKARLDAMLCGVPVMTTPVGFGREIVGSGGERGWVVPSGQADALASALQRLIDADPTHWPALRRRCRAYVEERTLEAWVDRIGEICSRQWNVPFVQGKLSG